MDGSVFGVPAIGPFRRVPPLTLAGTGPPGHAVSAIAHHPIWLKIAGTGELEMAATKCEIRAKAGQRRSEGEKKYF